MTQPRWQAFLEANASTWIGLVGSVALFEWLIKPVWHLHTSFLDSLTITAIFTAWSILRGYAVRRYFNWKQYGQVKA